MRNLKTYCRFIAAVDSGSFSKDRVNIAIPMYRIPGIVHVSPFLLSLMCILMSGEKNPNNKTMPPSPQKLNLTNSKIPKLLLFRE